MFIRSTSLSAVLLTVLIPATAFAQAADPTKAAASYQEAESLLEKGSVSQACTKFAESLAYERTRGTLFQLAKCHERDRKWASSWREYVAAAEMFERPEAGKEAKPERVKEAREGVKRVEANLQRVQLNPKEVVPEMKVKLDDQEISEASLKVPVLLDPGDHRAIVNAPGRKQAIVTFVLQEKAGSITPIELPALEVEKAAAGAGPGKVVLVTDNSKGQTQRTIGWITAGVGAVVGLTGGALATVGFFAAKSASEDKGAKTKEGVAVFPKLFSECSETDQPKGCPPADVTKKYNTGQRNQLIGGIMGAAGAAVIITGIVIVLTAPSATTEIRQAKKKDFSIRPQVGLGSLGLEGTW
jgi:hypothetical protein